MAGLSKRGWGENTQAEAPAQGAPVDGGQGHLGCSGGWLSPEGGEGGWGMVEASCLPGPPLPPPPRPDRMFYFRQIWSLQTEQCQLQEGVL